MTTAPPPPPPRDRAIATIDAWFDSRGWSPLPFQRSAWNAYLDGASGVVHAPTGTGKTLSVWLGPLIEHIEQRESIAQTEPQEQAASAQPAEPLRVLWLTPMRALAGDTVESLREPLPELAPSWTVESRTGDTSSSVKSRQKARLPTALVTTPESLSILLASGDAKRIFQTLRAVVVDEWHELLASKRGVMAELCLARLRAWNPALRTWGLSATLGNTEQASRVLMGARAPAPTLIRGAQTKPITIETILPASIERYPWTGHVGTRLIEQVLSAIDSARTTLLFTNTRAQAEIWFRALLKARPDMLGKVALHHGSLDREVRAGVERGLRDGATAMGDLRCVVCTSSLDLGVDFRPVDQVIQVGSPKGVARLIQRAGRSGHRPGETSRILGVPTHAMELVEFSAARLAVTQGELEHRLPIEQPLDLLVQHIVTIATGGGFDEQQLLEEIRTTWAYRDLTDEQWQWAMAFVTTGGPALTSYDKYARIKTQDSRWGVASPAIARMHRMGIGTITSDQAIEVRAASGRVYGTIEESFITKLAPGDRFVYSGRVLELVRLRNMTATVRVSTKRSGAIPRWNGGKMPLSTQLSRGIQRRLGEARNGEYADAEMRLVKPLLELQRDLSEIPAPGELLIERVRTRIGHHIMLYPFAGRLAHEGLAPVLIYRIIRDAPRTITATSNDYGVELLSDEPLPWGEDRWRALLSPDRVVEDLLASLDATELARRSFREIARIAGLTPTTLPGSRTSGRQLQASSDMFYEVFEQFDPGNLLLGQAKREVLEGQLEVTRLRETLESLTRADLVMREPTRLTPLGFPLFAEHLRATSASSEAWDARVRKMAIELEAKAP